jgi:hypothetical protein
MELTKRASYMLTTLLAGGLLAGCFSYHREVSHTEPAAVTPPASSTTTTTTTNDNGAVDRQSTTTYSNP